MVLASLAFAHLHTAGARALFQVATADVPVTAADVAGPDDPVAHGRAAVAFGGSSQVTYITRACREVAA